MPCDGVTVMQAQTEYDVHLILDRYIVRGSRQLSEDGMIRMEALIPMSDGNMMPVKIAIRSSGKMEAITQYGTFEMGKDALMRLINEIKAQGVTVDNLNWETHTHDGVGPMLAYSQPEAQQY
jgi:effector-binding domain-containing protein